MELSRRSFTSLMGSGLLLSTIQQPALSMQQSKSLASGFVSAASDNANQHWLVVLDANGGIKHTLAMPSRAHQITTHIHSPVVAVAARRPGIYLMIVDTQLGKITHQLAPQTGHHFYGHACYSTDGRYLFTTENHIASGDGYVFVRDAHSDYKIVNAFSSHGIGPHEIKVHPNGKMLIVANGGILTHPDSGRTKLNLDKMSPSLVYMSINDGKLIEKVQLPKHLNQLSIRHIDINQSGLTAIAMQYQGDKLDNVPLVAIHKQGRSLKTLWAPEHINLKMKHYCGSVCFNQSGSIFAVTSPRGNLLTLWDALDGEYITQFRCADVCGVSKFGTHGFSFSNGLGKLYTFDMKSSVLNLVQNQNHQLAWDNHLSILT